MDGGPLIPYVLTSLLLKREDRAETVSPQSRKNRLAINGGGNKNQGTTLGKDTGI